MFCQSSTRLRTLYAARGVVIPGVSELFHVRPAPVVGGSDAPPCASVSTLARVAPGDDRRVISWIIYVIRHGLQWKDAPRGYGPHKTLYNRFIRWSRLGVFARIFAHLAPDAGTPTRLMIDATHLKAHRTAARLLQQGLFPAVSGAPRAA
jgi:putative transposase